MNVYLLFTLTAGFIGFVDDYLFNKLVEHGSCKGIKLRVAFDYLYETVCLEAVCFIGGKLCL
jgi:hypothetical protein